MLFYMKVRSAKQAVVLSLDVQVGVIVGDILNRFTGPRRNK